MRPGLVFVGGLLLVLGAATIAAFNLIPSGTERVDGFSIGVQPFGPNVTGSAQVLGTDASAGTLSVTWRSTAALTVDLYPAVGCPLTRSLCTSGPAVAVWTGSTGGNWSTSGTLRFPYLLVWSEPQQLRGNLTASATESTRVAVTPAPLLVLLVDGTGAALAGIGAVAVFLGLFLRAGVYRGPSRLVSRSAEDVASVAGDKAPDDPERSRRDY